MDIIGCDVQKNGITVDGFVEPSKEFLALMWFVNSNFNEHSFKKFLERAENKYKFEPYFKNQTYLLYNKLKLKNII